LKSPDMPLSLAMEVLRPLVPVYIERSHHACGGEGRQSQTLKEKENLRLTGGEG